MMTYKDLSPTLGEGVFIAAGAHVIGALSVGRNSSIFYNSVVRADVNMITIGEGTNIQDNCTLHVNAQHPLEIANGVTVGHNVILHGCTIEDNVMIGMGAIVLDGAVIARDCIVAAGSLVPPGRKYPAGSMIMGSPAVVKRPLTDQEILSIGATAGRYITVKNNHLIELQKIRDNEK
jgi:carbonic anhydrase/acetyltransferase-like protein (isoleucine patch superfamily)